MTRIASRFRPAALAALGAAAALIAACGSTPVSLDNPLDGAAVQLDVDQPLRVRLSNVTGGGQWVREGDEPEAVSPKDASVRAEGAGIRQLETFEFVGQQPGADVLTFVYRRPGVQPDVSDVIRVKVEVG